MESVRYQWAELPRRQAGREESSVDLDVDLGATHRETDSICVSLGSVIMGIPLNLKSLAFSVK